MNLHGLAIGAISVVNPQVPATLKVSSGYTQAADYTQVPVYVDISVKAQVQALTYRDLQQVDGLNLNGTRRAIYLYGVSNGVVRVQQQGGDLIVINQGVNEGTWLVAMVLEQWPDWCKVAVTLQAPLFGSNAIGLFDIGASPIGPIT